jgi:hypothetical protein
MNKRCEEKMWKKEETPPRTNPNFSKPYWTPTYLLLINIPLFYYLLTSYQNIKKLMWKGLSSWF